MKKLHCLVCESTNDFRKIVDIPNQRPADFKNEFFTYYSCPNCGYYLLDPKLSPEEINKIYQKEEYYQELAEKPSNKVITKLFQFKIFSSYQDFTKENITKNCKLLDIGCGNGEFLSSLKKEGYSVFGMDPYPVAVQNSSEKIGKDRVYSGYIADLVKIDNTFDAVTMWHVLEHVQNPLADLKIIYSKLNKNGKVIVEVPNADSLAFKIFGKDYNYNMIPEHIQYFAPQSITKLFEKAGFKVQRHYTPPRALLNFALSLKNRVLSNNTTTLSKLFFFLFATPISIVFIIFSSLINKGEVVRVVAVKES